MYTEPVAINVTEVIKVKWSDRETMRIRLIESIRVRYLQVKRGRRECPRWITFPECPHVAVLPPSVRPVFVTQLPDPVSGLQ